MRQIDAKTLYDWIADDQELAILDAREDGEFGADHPVSYTHLHFIAERVTGSLSARANIELHYGHGRTGEASVTLAGIRRGPGTGR